MIFMPAQKLSDIVWTWPRNLNSPLAPLSLMLLVICLYIAFFSFCNKCCLCYCKPFALFISWQNATAWRCLPSNLWTNPTVASAAGVWLCEKAWEFARARDRSWTPILEHTNSFPFLQDKLSWVNQGFRNNIVLYQEHPTTSFGKISVPKTIWDPEFSEHLL